MLHPVFGMAHRDNTIIAGLVKVAVYTRITDIKNADKNQPTNQTNMQGFVFLIRLIRIDEVAAFSVLFQKFILWNRGESPLPILFALLREYTDLC